MLISDEYRQELLNYFPYLPKKDIFYQLLRQITDKVINSRNPFPELMTQIDYNNIGDDDNGYYKWKLAASILKRVDDIENDWTYSFIPQTSIYGLLECPVLQNSNCATQNWVDKSKYIPTIELPPPLHEISQETAHDKIQLDSTVLDRLTSFITVYDEKEQITLNRPTCASTSLTQIDVPSQPSDASSQGIDLYAASFLSQSYISDFKAIYQQRTSTKSKETCELDHFRFKF